MNPSLIALKSKLDWQQQELREQIAMAEKQAQQISQQITLLDDSLQQSSMNSLKIQPELEINRLNFITQQQEKKAILVQQHKEQIGTESKLKGQLKRIKSESHLLNNYLDKQKAAALALEIKKQSNALDEWALRQKAV